MGICERKIEKKSLREILRLNSLLHDEKDEEKAITIQKQIKICEMLAWKDYKSVYKPQKRGGRLK